MKYIIFFLSYLPAISVAVGIAVLAFLAFDYPIFVLPLIGSLLAFLFLWENASNIGKTFSQVIHVLKA